MQVFDNFSLSVNDRIFGLIGVNGAGKSTLLKLVLGLLQTSSGEIIVHNQNIKNHRKEVLKQVGVVFENPVFPGWTQVTDHLLYVGQIRGLTRQEAHQEVNLLLEVLNLEEKRQALLADLSAGLKQRFAIAQALIGSPSLIFLDEPTANLDAKSRSSVLKYLRATARDKDLSIIIFSHILDDLEKFCDSYGILHRGQLVRQEMIAELIQHEFIDHYQIRCLDPQELPKIREFLLAEGFEVLDEDNQEILVALHTREEVSKLQQLQFPTGVSIHPDRGLLEQVFFEEIGANS